MYLPFKLLFPIFFLLIALVGCHKTTPINNVKNAVQAAKKYYIKSLAAGPNDSTSFIYDDQMKLIKKITFTPSIYRTYGADTVVFYFSYNYLGQLDTLKTTMSHAIGCETFEYNADGTIARFNYLDKLLTVDYFFLIWYNNKKQVDSINYFVSDGSSNFKVFETAQFIHDVFSQNFVEVSGDSAHTETQYIFDNSNSMYQGIQLGHFEQSLPNGDYFGTDLIPPSHNLISMTTHNSGFNQTEKVSYIYNSDGYPTKETFNGSSFNGSSFTYRITYYVK